MTSINDGVGILDTGTVILLSRLTDTGALPAQSMITAITLAELSVGPLAATTDAERARRQAHFQRAEANFETLPFDQAAARAFGQVSADLRAAGRKASARAYDALIAAIAIANGLPLYTTNPDDFTAIRNLEVRPIPHPDRP